MSFETSVAYQPGFYHTPLFPSRGLFALWRFPVCIFRVKFSMVAQVSVLLTHADALLPLIELITVKWKARSVESPAIGPYLALLISADFSQVL